MSFRVSWRKFPLIFFPIKKRVSRYLVWRARLTLGQLGCRGTRGWLSCSRHTPEKKQVSEECSLAFLDSCALGLMVAFKSFLPLGIIGYERAFMPLGRLNCALTPRLNACPQSRIPSEQPSVPIIPLMDFFRTRSMASLE